MKARIGLFVMILVSLATLMLSTSSANCQFSFAFTGDQTTNATAIPWNETANFTKNEDFNNTVIYAYLNVTNSTNSTDCSCTPGDITSIILYPANPKSPQITVDGRPPTSTSNYWMGSFGLNSSYTSAGNYTNMSVTCEELDGKTYNKVTYNITGNFIFVKDEEGPSLVNLEPENNSIIYNNTLINITLWDPSGIGSIEPDENGNPIKYNITGETTDYWNVTLYPTPIDGNITITINAKDLSKDSTGVIVGNQNNITIHYLMDEYAPKIENFSMGPINKDEILEIPGNVSFIVNDTLPTKCIAEIEGKSLKSPILIINKTVNPGAHTLSAEITNKTQIPWGYYNIGITCADEGNLTSNYTSKSFIIDTTPPTVTLVSPKPGTVTNENITFEVNASDDSGKVSCYAIGHGFNETGPITTNDSTALDKSGYLEYTTNVTNAELNYSIECIDAAGNEKVLNGIAVLDDLPPRIRWLKWNPEFPVIGDNLTVSLRAVDMEPITASLIYTKPGAKPETIDMKEINGTFDSGIIQIDKNGTWQFEVDVLDGLKNTATEKFNITVDTQPPNVTYSITPGPGYIMVSANATDLNPFHVKIDLNGTNKTCEKYTNTTNSSLGITCNFTNLTEDKNYTILITATDRGNNTREINKTVRTLAVPVPRITWLPKSPYIWVKTFSAIGSYDPDGNITRYYWEFGDGSNATNETVIHVFKSPGTYTVKLIVTDNDNLTNITEVNVTIKKLFVPPRHHGGFGGGFGGGVIATPVKPKPRPKSVTMNWSTSGVNARMSASTNGNRTSITIIVSAKKTGYYQIIQPIPPSMSISQITTIPKWDKIESGKLVWNVYLNPGNKITIKESVTGKISKNVIEELKPVISSKPPLPAQTVRVAKVTKAVQKPENKTNTTIKRPMPLTGRITQANEKGLGRWVVSALVALSIIAIFYVLVERSHIGHAHIH